MMIATVAMTSLVSGRIVCRNDQSSSLSTKGDVSMLVMSSAQEDIAPCSPLAALARFDQKGMPPPVPFGDQQIGRFASGELSSQKWVIFHQGRETNLLLDRVRQAPQEVVKHKRHTE